METQRKNGSLRTRVVSILLVCCLCLAGAWFVQASSSGGDIGTETLSYEPFQGAPSYTILANGTSYFAKDAHGVTDYQGTNVSCIVNTVINALPSNLGGSIYFASGDYYFSNSIIIDRSNVTLEGEGAGNTQFFLNAGANCHLIAISNKTINSVNFIYVENLELWGDKQAEGPADSCQSDGIYIHAYAGDMFFTNVFIDDFQSSGILACPTSRIWNVWIQNCEIEGCNNEGIYLMSSTGLDYVHITDNYLFRNNNGIRMDGIHDRSVDIEDNVIYGNLQRGMLLEGAQYVNIVGNQIFDNSVSTRNTYDGIYIGQYLGQNSYYITINGNTITNEGFYNTQRDGVFIGDLSDRLTIMGNTLYGNSNSSIHIAHGAAKYSTIANNTGYP